MTEQDDQNDIIRTIQVLDRDAVDDLAETIETVIGDFQRAAGKLTNLTDQAQRHRAEAEQASAKLEQRLRLGLRLLKALQERTDTIAAATEDLDERQRRTEQAEARLEQQFVEFDDRLKEAVAQFQQHTTNTSDAMLERASAVAQITEKTEVNVALMAQRVSEALVEARQQPQIVAPPPTPSVDEDVVEGISDRDECKDTVEADPTPGTIATAESFVGPGLPLTAPPRDQAAPGINDLRSTTTELQGELDALSARCERLKAARQSALDPPGSPGSPSQFLAEMSSELRTPIDGVISMIELLRDTKLDDEQQRYLNTAEYAVAAMSSLLESVLELPRLDEGEIELDTSDFDVRSMVQEAVNMLAPAANKRGIELVQCVAPEVPALVRGDPGRLRQVLLYSMNRAIKLAEQGEVSLNVAVQHQTHSHTTLRFQLAHESTTIPGPNFVAPRQDNTGPETDGGLGLTISGKLVQLMGGEFGVDTSQDEDGLTIWFTVTLTKPTEANDDRRAHARLPQEALKCNLGEVLNLSLGGMRVRCTRAPKDTVVEVELTYEGETMKVQAEVVRSNKIGFRKHELGLRFLDVDPETAKQLTRVSLNHWVRHTLGDA
ncbi:MAG: PilZ domain-containing protein [Planctomycetes bacterium]|nr:PilZ domain-containing protein [Planctomycetota bacterium]